MQRVSLIEEEPSKHVRMANLAVVGSHSTNGVAAIHSRLLRSTTLRDLVEIFPDRFNNKTNGVTPRRWLLLANPQQSAAITDAIGDAWITDLRELKRLRPLADDAAFRADFQKAKRHSKLRFADWLKNTYGYEVDVDSIFDCQVKRIHEYKRQLLNALRIVVLYNRLRANPKLDELAPRTFFFAGKAAPAYHLAKVIIKFINNLAATIDADPLVRGRIKVLFLPEYNVTLAERLIPAADVSNQISTAGYEASGTSNMKFMMNAALTIGTRDGATIEMAEEAGEENFFLFGLTAQQVSESRDWYNPHWHYDNEPDTRAALDLIFSGHFDRGEPRIFDMFRKTLLGRDHYMHLADLKSYLQASQRLGELYAEPDAWTRKAVLNVAGSGEFSSDRTIAQYASEIWARCHVRLSKRLCGIISAAGAPTGGRGATDLPVRAPAALLAPASCFTNRARATGRVAYFVCRIAQSHTRNYPERDPHVEHRPCNCSAPQCQHSVIVRRRSPRPVLLW